MKKKYAVVSVMVAFMSLSTFLSQAADTSVAPTTKTIFAPLEKNRVPNNILLDYCMDIIYITANGRTKLISHIKV